MLQPCEKQRCWLLEDAICPGLVAAMQDETSWALEIISLFILNIKLLLVQLLFLAAFSYLSYNDSLLLWLGAA